MQEITIISLKRKINACFQLNAKLLGQWSSCDRGGCQANAFNVDSNMFCPESR